VRPLVWRHLGELPQDGNAARVVGLWRVREGLLHFRTKRFARPMPRFAQLTAVMVKEARHVG